MPTFILTTRGDREIAVKADYYNITDNGDIHFRDSSTSSYPYDHRIAAFAANTWNAVWDSEKIPVWVQEEEREDMKE